MKIWHKIWAAPPPHLEKIQKNSYFFSRNLPLDIWTVAVTDVLINKTLSRSSKTKLIEFLNRTCISRIRSLGFIPSRFRISHHAKYVLFNLTMIFSFLKLWYFCQIFFSQISDKRIVLTDCEDSEESGENTPTEVDFRLNICNKWIYMDLGFMFQTYGGIDLMT